MARGFDGFEIDDFRDSGFDSGRDVDRGSSSSWNDANGLYYIHREEEKADRRDREGRERSRTERPTLAREELNTGNHARNLFARGPGRAASRSRERRETGIWTQMDRSSGSGATGIDKIELKNQALVVGAWRFELQTSCAQGNCKKSISLVRLALFCVMVLGFGPNLSAFGPKWTQFFSRN
jgi:hypothetical protein